MVITSFDELQQLTSSVTGKIGWFSISRGHHVGHEWFVQTINARADYVVVFYFDQVYTIVEQLVGYKKWPKEEQTWEPDDYSGTISWLESVSDVVLRFDEKKFPFVYKDEAIIDATTSVPDEPPFPGMEEEKWKLFRSFQIILYTYLQYCPIKVGASSYKDGLFRLMFRKYAEDKGLEYELLPPYRDGKMVVSYSDYELSSETKDFLKTTDLLNSKDLTKEELELKLSSTDGRVKTFYRYQGSYLQPSKDGGDTFLWANIVFPSGQYIDGVIL